MTGRRAAACMLVALLGLPASTAGSRAPASIWSGFAGRDLEGRLWTAETLEGKVVLLDFWATWCAPCLAALPGLREATERFGDQGFLVLGVSMDRTDRRRLESFLRRQGVDWPQLHDGRGFESAIARRFGVEVVPRTFLVDRYGRIVGVDLAVEILLAALPALLEQTSP